MRSSIKYLFQMFAIILLSGAITTCENDSIKALQVPIIETDNITNISCTGATIGGIVISDGGATVTERGVYWGLSTDPKTTGTKLVIGYGTGTFSSNLSSLTANTKYYVVAYAKNSVGEALGIEINFTTSTSISTPNVITASATSITITGALVGGNITSDGGASVTERGVYWGNSANPRTIGTKLAIGSGVGTFSSTLSSLTANTKYYVVAYSINSVGESLGSEVNFTTASGQTGTLTDNDGNVYNTITIGTQTWMAENLRTTKYRDGTAIPNVTDVTAWATLTTGAYCNYDNIPSNSTTYGKLYNRYSVDDSRKLCPSGWHVPYEREWTTLITYLGGENVAGGKLKATALWYSPNTGATNETGFTALPGGLREFTGTYRYMGNNGFWWSSNESYIDDAWYRKMYYNHSIVLRFTDSRRNGFSVRCVRDN